VRIAVDLAVSAVVGVLPFEREKPQRILASVKIDYEYRSPRDFVDYAAVADLIKTRLIEGRFGLLEEAIEALAPEIMKLNPSIAKIKLSLEKPDISAGFRAVVSSAYIV
jgi:dihydroneopterin aldolase